MALKTGVREALATRGAAARAMRRAAVRAGIFVVVCAECGFEGWEEESCVGLSW